MTDNHNQPGENHERRPEQQYHPRIWIASLADYNAGILHGRWVDATQDPDDLEAAAREILTSSHEPSAEEYAIFDYDEFGSYRVQEYDRLEDVSLIARGIAEHGDVFAVWAELHDGDPAMMASFEDAYLGTYDSAEQWAEQLLDDEGIPQLLDKAIPDDLRNYVSIDYEAWARDAQISGSIHIEDLPDGRVAVFDVT
ncbi:Antirestriction protein [Raineyella antarctica]|uniref:Antirestriction protein n=1 Tax=Raineyella antarctica TaxID=1577474 RepID=A0A1G6H055_9ACTN|nr:antirestriction protein ArdA [Raineyella antarctica]SDB87315.1 Antirestriction protein [Raineyella antarctica]